MCDKFYPRARLAILCVDTIVNSHATPATILERPLISSFKYTTRVYKVTTINDAATIQRLEFQFVYINVSQLFKTSLHWL